jgi:hypothetical protein
MYLVQVEKRDRASGVDAQLVVSTRRDVAWRVPLRNTALIDHRPSGDDPLVHRFYGMYRRGTDPHAACGAKIFSYTPHHPPIAARGGGVYASQGDTD